MCYNMGGMMITDVFDIESEYYKEMMNIIIYSKLNKPEKGDIHHIIPKCYYKHYNMEIDNSISNTVLLTWENHKKVHNLAYKCAKHFWLKNKLACACYRFGDTEPKHIMTEETKRKLSEAHKGRKLSEEHKKKISESNKGEKSYWYGKKLSEETRKKMSDSQKCKTISEETKKKMSENLKRRYQDPKEREKQRLLYKGKTWSIVDGKRVWRDR